MRRSPKTLVTALLKLVLVVAVSGGVGLGLGYGLSEVKGTGGGAAPAAFRSPSPAATGAGTTGTTGAKADTVQLDVLSAVLEPAATPSGRRRQRARLTVRLKASNDTGEEVTLETARVAAGGSDQATDPAAATAAGALLKPIADGQSASGEYRFETAGTLTATLQSRRQATLRVGQLNAPLQITVG